MVYFKFRSYLTNLCNCTNSNLFILCDLKFWFICCSISKKWKIATKVIFQFKNDLSNCFVEVRYIKSKSPNYEKISKSK